MTDTAAERACEIEIELIARALCRTHARHSPDHTRSDEEVEKFIDWHWPKHGEAEAIIPLLRAAEAGAIERAAQVADGWRTKPHTNDVMIEATVIAHKIRALVSPSAMAERTGAGAASPWREIASAPKDGTRVLLWDGRPEPLIGYWFDGYWDGSNPTHWMPLPSPPASEGTPDA